MDIKNMTNIDLTTYLVDSAGAPAESKMAYAAGYFESTLLSMMAKYPEVRKDIEERVAFRIKEMM